MKLNSNNKKAKLKNHMVSKYLHVVFFLNIFVSCKFTTIQCAQFNTNPKLLFISFDGFRWDYLTKYNLPNFNYLKSIGSHADFIYSSFATSTFPNHWTLVTGLFEESHGIISNEMYDPDMNETFSMGVAQSQTLKWYGQNPLTVPIWTLNQKNGNRRKSAAEWVGSSVPFDNEKIIDIPYKGSRPFNDLIDQFVHLFADDTDPINFGALYFNEPDQTGHLYGPFSLEMKQKLNEVDDNLRYLIEKLKKLNLFDSLNLIITSDHGMRNVSNQTVVYLDHYVNISLFDAHGGVVNMNLFLKNLSNLDDVYSKLKKAVHLDVYKRNEIPDLFHYKNNKRVGDILIAAKLGYTVYLTNNSTYKLLGEHGYDNQDDSMHSIFIASGPRFKKDFKVRNFNNVDIYSLMCKVLEIEPGVHNGSLEIIQSVLITDQSKYKTIYIIISVIPVISATLTAIFLCYMHQSKNVLNTPTNYGYMIVSSSDLNETTINYENDNESGNSELVYS